MGIYYRNILYYEKTNISVMEVKMAFYFKKEYKSIYMPKKEPEIIEIPKMKYIAVRGKGNPNDEKR
mgnify:FL=1